MSPPGTLYVTRGHPNPTGGASALYLLHGDAAASPIQEVTLAPGVTLPPPPRLSARQPFRLTLLHFNDLHGRLAHVTSCGITPIFSRIAGRIRAERERCARHADAGLLTLAAGDDLVGAPFDELLGCTPAAYQCHPAYRLYSAAGVDACAVGNHDLDWGLAPLTHAARQDATFPLLAANLTPGARVPSEVHIPGLALRPMTPDVAAWRAAALWDCVPGQAPTSGFSGQGHPLICPAALFVVNGLRVGVMGLVTPAEVKQVIPGEFTVTHPVQAAQHLLPALRPLCDVLIILSHLGYSLACNTAVVVQAGDVELACALPRAAAHLVVGGHTHSPLNADGLSAKNIVNGIPIVQAGARGACLGEAHISVWPHGATVTGARLLSVPDLPVDEQFEATQVRPLAEQVRALLGQPLGRVADHPDLHRVNLRQRFASEESALANFMADALVARCRAAGHPVHFALVDASSLPAELPPCDTLTYGDLFQWLPYADSIALCHLPPAQLQALLDDNARRADRPAESHTERGFLQFSREIRYTVELGPERCAAHAAGIMVNGTPLATLLATQSEPLLVACSSFVRTLATHWERDAAQEGVQLWSLKQLPFGDTGLSLRREMLAFVRAHDGVVAEAGLGRDGRLQCRRPAVLTPKSDAGTIALRNSSQELPPWLI